MQELYRVFKTWRYGNFSDSAGSETERKLLQSDSITDQEEAQKSLPSNTIALHIYGRDYLTN